MLGLITAFIVILIVIGSNNDKLQKENTKLKGFIRKYGLMDKYHHYLLGKDEEAPTYETRMQEEMVNERKIISKDDSDSIKSQSEIVETRPTDAEAPTSRIVSEKNQPLNAKVKNTLILAAGAFLIVLAAIVFLYTTWNTTPNAVKTGVMVVLIGLFLGMSYLSDEKFHLEQTSKTFYYIAMAYIPIVLGAISAFQLFGEYLSYKGEGNFLYFSICSIFLALLYSFEASKKKRDVLAIAGLIAQISAIFFICCHLKVSSSFIFLDVVLVYNILFCYITKMKKSELYATIYHYFTIAVWGIVGIFTSLMLVDCIVDEVCKLNHLIPLALLIFNYFCFKWENKYFVLLLDALILISIGTILNLEMLSISDEIQNLILQTFLMAIPTVRFLLTKDKDFKIIAYFAFGIIGAIMATNILSLVVEEKCTALCLISLILLMVNYFALQFKEKYIGFILDGLILLTGLTIINLKIFSVADKLEFFIISSLIMTIYIVRYFLSKDDVYKLIVYTVSNLFLGSILFLLDAKIEFYKYVPFVTTLAVLTIEKIKMKPAFRIYSLASFSLTFFILWLDSAVISFILAMVLGVIFVMYAEANKLSHYFYIIPLFALTNGLFFAQTFVVINLRIYMFLAFLMIAFLTFLSIAEKKDNMYTVASACYILLAMFHFELNRYVCVLMIMVWAILHIFTRKQNKSYLALFFTASLVLYLFVVDDLHLKDITLIRLFAFIPYIYLMSRKVFGKQKELEYVFTSIVYLCALGMYPNLLNAMIFIGFLLAMVVLGYQKKIGPLFLTSLIAVVINFFKQTYEFWKSVPWWVYLVVVGGALLAFAIHNEINENNNKEKLNKAIQSLKENVDL